MSLNEITVAAGQKNRNALQYHFGNREGLLQAIIDQLTEHLLGEAGEEASGVVTDHLASGCKRCNTLLAMLSRIRRVGRFDSEHQPPTAALRTVKALSGFARRVRESRRVHI